MTSTCRQHLPSRCDRKPDGNRRRSARHQCWLGCRDPRRDWRHFQPETVKRSGSTASSTVPGRRDCCRHRRQRDGALCERAGPGRCRSSCQRPAARFRQRGSQGSIEGVRLRTAVFFEGNPRAPCDRQPPQQRRRHIRRVDCGVGLGWRRRLDQQQRPDFGSDAVFFASNVATESVENSGTITHDYNRGNSAAALRAGINIVNSGLITDGHEGLLFFSDLSGTTSSIENEGTITGSGFAIVSEYGHSRHQQLRNNSRRAQFGGTVDVENSGHWHDGTGSGGVVFSLSGAGNSLTNSHAGTITGAISTGGTGDTIDNAGGIDGAITLPAATINSPTRATSMAPSRSPARALPTR